MHVHASDSKLTEESSAKFFVKGNGDSVLQERGRLNDREINKIQAFIKDNYQAMYDKMFLYMQDNGPRRSGKCCATVREMFLCGEDFVD